MKKLFFLLLMSVLTFFAVNAQTNLIVSEMNVPYAYSVTIPADDTTVYAIFEFPFDEPVKIVSQAYATAVNAGDTVDVNFTITKSEFNTSAAFVSAFSMDSLAIATPSVVKDSLVTARYLRYAINTADTIYLRLMVRAIKNH